MPILLCKKNIDFLFITKLSRMKILKEKLLLFIGHRSISLISIKYCWKQYNNKFYFDDDLTFKLNSQCACAFDIQCKFWWKFFRILLISELVANFIFLFTFFLATVFDLVQWIIFSFNSYLIIPNAERRRKTVEFIDMHWTGIKVTEVKIINKIWIISVGILHAVWIR